MATRKRKARSRAAPARSARAPAVQAALGPAPADPPRRKRGRPPNPRQVEAYERIGPPPVDQLDAMGDWSYRMLAQTVYDAAIDRRIGDRERRQEIRAGVRALSASASKARLRKAEKMLRDEANRIAAPRNVELEPAPDTPRNLGGVSQPDPETTTDPENNNPPPGASPPADAGASDGDPPVASDAPLVPP